MSVRDDAGAALWSGVVGQDDAVAQLRAAVAAPVHAYLLVGPKGSGRRAAARAFAAALLAEGLPPEAAERAARLALAEAHPDLEVVERTGPAISVDQAREIVRRASLSPTEGDRRVLLLTDFHLVDRAGPALLKAIEEPAPGTVFLVLAEEITPDLVTIASRCVVVELRPLLPETVARRLADEGVDPDRARVAAEAAGGDLAWARLLATDEDLARRQVAWRSVPERLDGRGTTVAALVDEVSGHLAAAEASLDAPQAAELEALREQVERLGSRGSGRREMEERHKRERRRLRTDELRAGLAQLAARYRDELATSATLEEVLASLDAIQAAAEALERNPNEGLLLQALFGRLTPLRR